MTEAPKPESPVTASPPASPQTGVTRHIRTEDGSKKAALLSGDLSDVVYRPLSSAAVAGFSIAALYTVVIVLGAVVSWIGGTPWLVGGWSVLFPVVAAGLCLAGWFTVQTSEGTRTGKSLAVWGLTLALITSVGYWSYYSVTYFFIRRDAEAYCLKWFDKIREGKLELAFLDTLPPKQRPRDDGDLRTAIENRFNAEVGQGSRPGGSHFNIFKQHLLTFALIQGGPDVEITPLGVTTWEYGSGGYTVRERYRIAAPDYRWEGVITLKSTESQGKQQRRGWTAVLMETTNEPASLVPTDEGLKKVRLQHHAASYLQEWYGWLRSPLMVDTVKSYLATLDPAQRKQVLAKYNQAQVPAAVAMSMIGIGEAWSRFVAASCDSLVPERQLPGFRAYLRGGLIQLSPDFWPPDEETRTNDLAEARQLFHGVTDMPMGVLHIDTDRLGKWKIEDGRFKVRHTIQFRLRNIQPSLEGVAYLDCDAELLKTGPTSDCWKIERIDLLSQRTVPAAAPPALQGRQPGQVGQ